MVVYADWSVNTRKRWACWATLGNDARYRVASPTLVGELDRFFPGLCRSALRSGLILAGFDFPLGLPAAYAAQTGISDFSTAHKKFGRGCWATFYEVAGAPNEISLHRLFFPQRPGSKGEFARAQLAQGLQLDHFNGLLRDVDRATGERPAASVMFRTLGSKQVGKAAISGWRDLLVPALGATDLDIALWPFDGALADLVQRFSPLKTIVVDLEREGLDLSGYAEMVTINGSRATLLVPKADTAQVTGRLLADLPIVDLTVEEPPIAEVIEQVFNLDPETAA